MTPDMHYRLALQIAEHGIDAHQYDVLRYATDLRRHGLRSAALDIVIDPTQPAVARERAFGALPVEAGLVETSPADTSPLVTTKTDVREPCSAAA
jgi:hypothetical protein